MLLEANKNIVFIETENKYFKKTIFAEARHSDDNDDNNERQEALVGVQARCGARAAHCSALRRPRDLHVREAAFVRLRSCVCSVR